jgi:hypothetical protein
MYLPYVKTADGQHFFGWIYDSPIIGLLSKFDRMVTRQASLFECDIESKYHLRSQMPWVKRLEKKWKLKTKKCEDGIYRYDISGYTSS